MFDVFDLLLFHKIVYNTSPIKLPSYIVPYDGNSRLRRCHLDEFSFICNLTPKGSMNPFSNSFFYKTHCKWNWIPLEIRKISGVSKFKAELINYLWTDILSKNCELTESDGEF